MPASGLTPRPARNRWSPKRGAGAIALANSLARAKRNIRYRWRIRTGYKGPRIVSEGDSWFQYPILLDDVIDNLIDDHEYAVLSFGGAGHLIEKMQKEDELHRGDRLGNAPTFFSSAVAETTLSTTATLPDC